MAISSFGHHIADALCVVCPQLGLIQTMALPDDLPWIIQKSHIDLYLTHKKKHLGDHFFKSLFVHLKSCYPDHRTIYIDGFKAESRATAAATSNNHLIMSGQGRLPGNASIFTAELQALKMAFSIVKKFIGDSFIIFTDSICSPDATTVITLLYKIF